MTKDEALKMAIEAFRNLGVKNELLQPALNACKEALEQQVQPLSDDEIKHIYNKNWENIQYGLDYADFIMISRAIEQAHGIK